MRHVKLFSERLGYSKCSVRVSSFNWEKNSLQLITTILFKLSRSIHVLSYENSLKHGFPLGVRVS